MSPRGDGTAAVTANNTEAGAQQLKELKISRRMRGGRGNNNNGCTRA